MDSILKIKNLTVHYETMDGAVRALNGINLDIPRGKTLGLVGETGAGKTTLAKSVMQLIQSPPGRVISGSVHYEGTDLLKASKHEMMAVRGRQIAMIFQDPMTSLNPVMRVGDQIAEAILGHEKLSKKAAFEKAQEMLELVNIPGSRAQEYATQFSGGMRQRVVIAIALSCNPSLLIADEPTTALDVTIQAQILELIHTLKCERGLSMLLITHDLGIVAQSCDYVSIMYAGEIIEYGSLHEIFKRPSHPYTIGLFGSIPKLNKEVRRLSPITGLMPDPIRLPEGCRFSPRCPHAKDICHRQQPGVSFLEGEHTIRCHLFAGQESEVQHG